MTVLFIVSGPPIINGSLTLCGSSVNVQYMNSPAIQYTESSVFSVTVGGAGVHV